MVFETHRTILRELVKEDSEFILRLVNTPGWLTYIGDRGIRNLDDAGTYLLNGPLESYRCHGYGLWLVMDKQTSVPLGICGLLKRNTLPHPDVGFAFLPEYHGLGYASESVKAVLTLSLERFNLSTLVAITVPDNARSIRLLKDNGFTYQHEITDPQTGVLLNLFLIQLRVQAE